VQNAIQAIYRDLEYAKTLIKARTAGSKNSSSDALQDDDLAVDVEESWTFIGDESDPELQKRIRDWDPTAYIESRASTDRTRARAVGAVKPSAAGKGGHGCTAF
jgi:sterol 3beta-glucosyltransferase